MARSALVEMETLRSSDLISCLDFSHLNNMTCKKIKDSVHSFPQNTVDLLTACFISTVRSAHPELFTLNGI